VISKHTLFVRDFHRSRSNQNSYEAKANLIKNLKGKEDFPGTKAKTKKARTSTSKELATSTIKRHTRRMNVTVIPKIIRSTSHKQTWIDHASPSLSTVVSEVNLTTNNKDW